MPRQHSPEREFSGGSPSWEELRKRAIDILRWRARGLPQTDWEDMAQGAVLKTIIALAQGRVDMQRLDFDGWFYTVVHHEAINWWRRNRAYVPLEEGDEPKDARGSAELEELLAGRDLQALIESTPSLHPHERTVLEMTYWYGLSSREIADILGEGVSATVVRTWHARALKKLSTHLRRA